jgi:hypothetical protein
LRDPDDHGRDRLLHATGDLHTFLDELDGEPRPRRPQPPQRLELDPEGVERDLARLVLTIVELLRELMERQAIRRMDAGQLTDEQVERLGATFQALQERMAELTDVFGLEPEDLNLDLGPLGSLLDRP